MRVWVVMADNFVDRVFSTQALADHFIFFMTDLQERNPQRAQVNWRAYDFILDLEEAP